MNSYNWQSGCLNYQMTAFVFFIFKSAGEGEEWFESDSTWLIHYKKKPTKNTDSHPAVLLNSFKFCAPVVFVWFWLFFSWGRWYKRGSDSTIFYYHEMNLLYSIIISKILVGIYLILFLSTFFLERDISMIFCGHRHIIITHCLTLA